MAQISKARPGPFSSAYLLKADLGHVLRAGTRLEVVVIHLETAHPRPNAVRKLLDEGVVVLNVRVVAHPGYADPVFRAGQLVGKALEVGILLEVRIILRQCQQPSKSSIEGAVGLNGGLRI